MRFLARLFIALLVVLVYIGSIPSVYAQSNPYLNPNTTPDVPKDLHTWTQSVMISVMAGLSCQLTGIDPLKVDPQTGQPSRKCLGVDPTTGKIGFAPGGNGAIGVMGHFIAATFTPLPVSTGEYLAYMGGKFGIAQPAYAQGVGFKGISPIAKIWEGFRNITYLLFVIAFVAVGFMIMLRVKIDPRTVMTIQNSIPRIIVGLILVTFTFAISGFLIDVMYLGTSVVTNALVDMADDKTKVELTQVPQAVNPFDAANIVGGAGIDKSLGPIPSGVLPSGGFLTFATGPAGSVAEAAKPFGEHPIGRVIIAGAVGAIVKILGPKAVQTVLDQLKKIPGMGGIVSGLLTHITGSFLDKYFGDILGGIAFIVALPGAPGIAAFFGFLIAFIILAIAVIWTLARLWIQLLGAYIWILIDIVTSPLWIIAGMFPGSPISFSAWLRDMGANLSAFPTTIAMLLLAKIFMGAFKSQTGPANVFVPPLVGPQDANIIAPFIGLGFIFLTPVVVTMMKDAFKGPKFPYGAAIGQAVGVGPALAGGITTQVFSPYGGLSYMQRLGEGFGALNRKEGLRGLTKALTGASRGGVEPQEPQKSQAGRG